MSDIRSVHFHQFFRRRIANSSFDSICGLCFQTVATAPDKEVLESMEAAHSCLRAQKTVVPVVPSKSEI
jgi:hypothetical protein